MEGEPKTVYYGSDEEILCPKRAATRKGSENPLVEDSDSDADDLTEEFHTPRTPRALKPDEAAKEKKRILQASRKKKPTACVKKGDRYLYGTIIEDDDVDRLSEGLDLTLKLADDIIQLVKWMEEYAHLSRNVQVLLREALTEQVERATDLRNILAQIKTFREREIDKGRLRKKVMESGTQVTPGLRSGIYRFTGTTQETATPCRETTPAKRRPEPQEAPEEVVEITPLSTPMEKPPTPKAVGVPIMPMEHESISSKRKERSSPGEEPITRRRKEGDTLKVTKVPRVCIPRIDGPGKTTPKASTTGRGGGGDDPEKVVPLCETAIPPPPQGEYPEQGEKWQTVGKGGKPAAKLKSAKPQAGGKPSDGKDRSLL